MGELINIKNLTIEYVTDEDTVYALNGVSIKLNAGQSLGLVGETGAGKTTLAKGIMRLIPQPPGKYVSGQVVFEGRDILGISEKEMRKIRGNQMSMIFQDPMTSLNPVMTVGEQIMEVVHSHNKCSKEEAYKRALEMLAMVGISAERANEYPHQFSGGMKQRVIVAIALACSPKLLIADEPTTALDVTIQAQVLEMMRNLRKKFNTAMLLITHDLGVVAQNCDNVAIIYSGEVVEYGDIKEIFKNPKHPYTIGLFGSIPNLISKVKRLKPIKGMMPDPTKQTTGCKFAERCDRCIEKCSKEKPELIDLGNGHTVSCFLMEDVQ